MNSVRISSIRFFNFKALSDYSLSLQGMNILVGPNNSGKSTIMIVIIFVMNIFNRYSKNLMLNCNLLIFINVKK